ncbi:MAG: hypothetical protein HY721_27080 [Planctomycetes bacterium]|nr:hypothetical protein [Planctomycetota bacterium]
MGVGEEEIADDELLYRRISENTRWHQGDANAPVHRKAFQPNKGDLEGLSVSRAKYETPEAAAGRGRRGKSYYLAVLKASDLRAADIAVAPKPQEADPGHAELPALRSDNRKSNEVQGLMMQIARLVVRVEGPFPGAADEAGDAAQGGVKGPP